MNEALSARPLLSGGVAMPSLVSAPHRRKTRLNEFSCRIREVVFERYLRRDLPCGVRACPTCSGALPGRLGGPPTGRVVWIVAPDTLLRQAHVLSFPHAICDLVLTPQALSMLWDLNANAFRDIIDRTNDPSDRVHLFRADFHRDVHAEPVPGEGAEVSARREAHNVLRWYRAHLGDLCDVNMLADHDDTASTFHQVVEQNAGLGPLRHAMVAYAPESVDALFAGRPLIYTPHAQSRACTGQAYLAGAIVQSPVDFGFATLRGRRKRDLVHASAKRPLSSSRPSEPGAAATATKIHFESRLALNRALHGDWVVVEKEATVAKAAPEPLPTIRTPLEAIQHASAPDTAQRPPSVPVVIAILRRNPTHCVGWIYARPSAAICPHPWFSDLPPVSIVLPESPRMCPVLVRSVSGFTDGAAVSFIVDGWHPASPLPHGHVIRQIEGGDEGDTALHLLRNGIRLGAVGVPTAPTLGGGAPSPPPFNQLADENLPRVDLRHLSTFSVDPEGAGDIDDAIHLRRLPNGRGYQVGVHIADVSTYVRPQSEMDRIARDRGMSLYLENKRIPMLPDEYAQDICSLRANADRRAVSVIFDIGLDGGAKSGRPFTFRRAAIHLSLIRSRAALAYAQADEVIASRKKGQGDAAVLGGIPSQVAADIRTLSDISQKLRRDRIDRRGALNLSRASEKNAPASSTLSMQMIEEWMLLANCAAAQCLASVFPAHAIARRHVGARFAQIASDLGLDDETSRQMSGGSAQSLLALLQTHFGKVHDGNHIAEIYLQHHLGSSEYACVGRLDRDRRGHFGLGVPLYTHFTSPIRRYADILVHRMLKWAMIVGKPRAILGIAETAKITPKGAGASVPPPLAPDAAYLPDLSTLSSICLSLNIQSSHASRMSRYFSEQAALRAITAPAVYSAIPIGRATNGVIVSIPVLGLITTVVTETLPKLYESVVVVVVAVQCARSLLAVRATLDLTARPPPLHVAVATTEIKPSGQKDPRSARKRRRCDAGGQKKRSDKGPPPVEKDQRMPPTRD